MSSIILAPGDVLLLEARPGVVDRLKQSRDFLLMNVLDHELPDHSHALLSWAILGGIIALATTGIMSMLNASLLGVALMLATRCISVSEARRALDLPVLVTIAASFALGNALEKTGAADYLGNGIVAAAGNDAWLLLALTYFSVMVLTELITNNAAAMLMLPVVLAITHTAGLNEIPYVMTVMMAASASFATPIGYQCNLMVYGPGGYHFSDFLRIGVPMNLLMALVTIVAVPFIWPLQG
jgi:di/tricarboxylate transporter